MVSPKQPLDTIIQNPKRIKALYDTLLLDTKAEAAFDRLTNMAARILGAPISLISLIDVDRQFVKSGVGTDVDTVPLSHSFCQHVVATGKPLIIEDARQHPTMWNNPAINDFDVIGYLGLPIYTKGGYNIGSLCVIDNKPRQWSDEEVRLIKELTDSVMIEIDLRVQLRLDGTERDNLSTTEVWRNITHDENSFGEYEIISKIGSGGMADVYLCKHRQLKTMAAIKQLRSTVQNYRQFAQRFQREIDIIQKLKHPNIIRVFDFGMKDSAPYMVMEYINGEDLEGFLGRNGKLTFEQDGAILLDLAEALDYAHAHGIVHRDIKPANVMLRRRFRDGDPINQFHATLTDFGIAKLSTHDDKELTGDNVVGTLSYASPEQLFSEDDLDYRADIYSFGILAYQMLTGHLPFESVSVGHIINMHLNMPMPDPRQYVPSLTDSQVEALQQALAKKPDERPQSARDFVVQLGR